MRTTKPISTISYNSPDYLALKLDELRSSGIVSFWSFIRHDPEDDEGGKKAHFHVYVEPSRMLQTDEVQKMFEEFDPEHPDKPLGCITWHSSKFPDWYLYSCHNTAYLAAKGQSRQFHYEYEEFVYSSEPDFRYRVRSIDMTHLTPIASIIEAIKKGYTWAEYLASGVVPFQQLKLYQSAWFSLCPPELRNEQNINHYFDRLDRAGRIGHDKEEK